MATITRLDWVSRLSSFHAAYHRYCSEPQDDIERLIDQAFAMEFSNRPVGGIIALETARRMIPRPATQPVEGLAAALQVQCVPMISRADRPGLLRLRITPIDATRFSPPLSFSLQIDSAPDAAVLTQKVTLESADTALSLTLSKPDVPCGTYELRLNDGARDWPVGRWFVVPHSLDAQRVNNERQMSTTRPATQPFIDAKTIARSRNALLTDQVSLDAPGVLIDDPSRLSTRVQDEVASLMRGQNPFWRRSGDQWIGIPCGGGIIPARLYVPNGALDRAAPLLIGLADATDDENDWLDHLGSPLIQSWADRTGTIVLLPRPLAALSVRQPIKTMADCLRRVFGLKIDRIDLIGHGLGAAAAVDFSNSGGEPIDKLVLIGGGEINGVKTLPPTLLINGGQDRSFDTKRCDAVMEYAQQHGLPVTHRSLPKAGHALLLSDSLNDALSWLGQR